MAILGILQPGHFLFQNILLQADGWCILVHFPPPSFPPSYHDQEVIASSRRVLPLHNHPALVVEEYADMVVEDEQTKFILLGLNSGTIYIIYHFSFLFFVFFFPLVFLIITHIIIIKLIQRYSFFKYLLK